jgi:hypothetical protein
MSWFSSSDDQRKAIEEIEQTKSDRAAAIVGAAFLEENLRNAIEARLRADENIVNKMFKPSGSLGAFEVKADLGFLLRVYEKDVHADLVTLGKIRNAFAHWRKPIKFDSKDIKALCRELKLVDKDEYPKMPGPGLPDELRSPERIGPDASPTERFILTIKLMVIIFWAASHDLVLGRTRSTDGANGTQRRHSQIDLSDARGVRLKE